MLSASSLSFPRKALNHSLSLEEEEEIEEDDDIDGEIEYDLDGVEEEEKSIESGIEMLELKDNVVVDVNNGSFAEDLKKSREKDKVPNLTVKEKKELASYAHGLGKKLKCQLVGKSGVTDNVASSFIENLEANELLKVLYQSIYHFCWLISVMIKINHTVVLDFFGLNECLIH